MKSGEVDMRKGLGYFRGIVAACAVATLLKCQMACAADGAWTCAADSTWTNSANWSVSPFAGYNTVETATFNAAGNGNTTLDIANLYSIWGLVFDTANVAAYTIGAGGVNSQTLVMGGNGTYYLSSTAGNNQVVNATLQLGGSNVTGSYFFRNESTSQKLTFAGNVGSGTGSSAGTKTMSAYGAGSIVFSGNLYKGTANALVLTNGLLGTLTLSGSNTIQTLYLGGSSPTVTDIGGGFLGLSNAGSTALYATQDAVINGTGKIWLSTVSLVDSANTDYANCYVASGKTVVINPEITGTGGFELNTGTGTFVLNGNNTFQAHVSLNGAGTLSVSNIGNKGSLTSNLGQGGVIRFVANNARLLYTGAGETSDRSLRLEQNGTIDHSGSGTLTFSSDLDVRATTKTLTLQGSSDGVGVIAGVISNGTATTSLAKNGSGTWRLTAANTYAGATTVTTGTLAIAGANGAIASSSGFTVASGATLLLENSVSANNADRVRDAAALTLAGGTLNFSNSGGAANYAETVGAVTVTGTNSTLNIAQADDGQTSALTLTSLARSGTGTLNFTGTGLGESDRCRIFISGQPDGVIGLWATINGSALAAYNSTRGVYAMTSASISARGPSVLPDDASANVSITSAGTSGPITLAGDPISHVGMLQQATDTPAVVATVGKTLLAGALTINAGQESLTVGENEGDGTLAPLGAGGSLFLGNDAASALTVNAVVADNVTASSLTKNGTGDVIIKGAATYTGLTAINNGTLIIGGHSLTQTLAGVISGNGALTKIGTNVLYLYNANTYAGPTTISEGIVRVNRSAAFGAATAGTTIAGGATLDLGCTPDVGGTVAANTLNMQTETITVQGAGTDGKGAIINNSTGSQYNAIGKVTLSGDTTFSARSRWDIRDGWMAMNDHAVTKLGADTFSLSQVEVTPGAAGAAAFDIQEGTFRLQRTTQFNGSSTNTVHMRSATVLDLYDLAANPAWNLLFEDGTTYNIDDSTSATQNFWGGPVTLNGLTTLTSDGSYNGGFAGAISGAGALLKTNTHTFAITATNSTYTGATQIRGGVLCVNSLRNVGEACSLGQPATVDNGTIKIGSGTADVRLTYNGTGNTTDRLIDMAGTTGKVYLDQSGNGLLKFNNLVATGAGSKTLYLQGSTSGVGEVACMITNCLTSGAVGVNKSGTGAWVLSGNNRYTGSTTVDAGSLTCSGYNILSGAVTVNAGSLTFAGTNVFAGSLNIVNGFMTMQGTNNSGSADLYAGATNRNGTLTLAAGATLSGSGNFRFGIPGGNGALYINGGSLWRTQAASDQNFVFGRDLAYGYLNMTDGSVTAGRFQMAGVNVPVSVARGVARISGGTLSFSDYLLFARNPGCEAVLTMDGGTLNHINAAYGFCLAFSGGRAEVNLTGGTLNNTGKSLSVLQNNGAGATGIVNVCSGILTTLAFENFFSGVAYLNLSGGTLKPSASSTVFLPATMTGVYSRGPFGAYAGGGVFDTAGFNITVAAPLQAPSGQGIFNIALSNQGSGYIGEPYVSIEGGNGVGATAVANMVDDGTGSNTYKVASVTITSPGVNYSATPTVLFKGGGYNVIAAEAGAVTLANNTSGGLTKTGLGTLTLSATNTYGGTTLVSGGTLKLGNAKALPTQTRLTLAGGTLDLSGFTVTNTLSGSGTVTNGTLQVVLSPAGEGTIGADTLALTLKSATVKGVYRADVTAAGACDSVAVQGNINLSDFALQIVNPGQLDSRQTYTLLTCTGTRTGAFSSNNLTDSRWHILYAADGSVKLFFARGTLMRVL